MNGIALFCVLPLAVLVGGIVGLFVWMHRSRP